MAGCLAGARQGEGGPHAAHTSQLRKSSGAASQMAMRPEGPHLPERPMVSVAGVDGSVADVEPPGLAVRFQIPIEEVRRDTQRDDRIPGEAEQMAVARA